MKFFYDHERVIYTTFDVGPEQAEILRFAAFLVRPGRTISNQERQILWRMLRGLERVYLGHQDAANRNYSHTWDKALDDLRDLRDSDPVEYAGVDDQPLPPVLRG